MTGGLHTAGTYGGLFSEGRLALEQAGIPNAALDARVLLSHVTRKPWEWLFSEEDEIASPGEIAAFREAVGKRIRRVPVARIVAHKEFWSLDFELNDSTLIPRPESEHIIERALELMPRDAQGRMLDLGTGSGCLLIALLKERPQLTGIGLDRSFCALRMARRNAERHGVAQRAHFVQGDWTNPLCGLFDLVVANPPYLSEAELEAAEPEVRDHEPRRALCAGPEGLEAYEEITEGLARLLAPGAWAVLEISASQAEKVTALLKARGLDSIGLTPDLAGLPRVLSARKVKETKVLSSPKKRLESAS
jgi:release factor glutamine methyltransferase